MSIPPNVLAGLGVFLFQTPLNFQTVIQITKTSENGGERGFEGVW